MEAESQLLSAKDLNDDYKLYEPALKADILYQLADCSDRLGELEAARARAMQADSLYLQAGIFSYNYFNNCINLIQIYNDLNDNESAHLYERVITQWNALPIPVKEQLQKHLGISDTLLDRGRQLLADLKAVYGNLSDTADVNTQKNYQKALNDYHEHQSDLFKIHPEYKSLKINIIQQNSLTQIRQNMSEKTVLMEYFWGQNELITAVITPQQQHLLTQPLTVELKNRVDTFRSRASRLECDLDTLSLDARQLYHDLLEKPLVLLKKQGFQPKSLIVIPDDKLSYLSLKLFKIERE